MSVEEESKPHLGSIGLSVAETPIKGNSLVSEKRVICGSLIFCDEPLSCCKGTKDDLDISLAIKIAEDDSLFRKSQSLSTNLDRMNNSQLRQHACDAGVVAKGISSTLEGPQRLLRAHSTLARVRINAVVTTNSEGRKDGLGIFLTISLLNHSCNPNATVWFDGDQAVVRACRDIEPGDEITISYIDRSMSRFKRKEALLRDFYFDCCCDVCADERKSHKPFLIVPKESWSHIEDSVELGIREYFRGDTQSSLRSMTVADQLCSLVCVAGDELDEELASVRARLWRFLGYSAVAEKVWEVAELSFSRLLDHQRVIFPYHKHDDALSLGHAPDLDTAMLEGDLANVRLQLLRTTRENDEMEILKRESQIILELHRACKTIGVLCGDDSTLASSYRHFPGGAD